MLGNFLHAFCRLSIYYLRKIYFRNTIRKSNRFDLDQAQCFVSSNKMSARAQQEIGLQPGHGIMFRIKWSEPDIRNIFYNTAGIRHHSFATMASLGRGMVVILNFSVLYPLMWRYFDVKSLFEIPVLGKGYCAHECIFLLYGVLVRLAYSFFLF